ncbi:DNA-binding response regulator, OmpR family, contains REC and winged-helix (wHTH) domain [[Clostridium] fimetarium]|uniref:Stage 0 sporulation protein A homolog n=2 Tax=[Clostridium] fimetarium TaxID=99656 RepID=A0A1I0M6Z8_9FIRM|nr:DNA-binding response regulator, OmpR family, contains REC and winged-helix (wHTH) domain [[Clostridium] fimetarium]
MNDKKKKVLIVDDEVKIVEAVAAYLENSGYTAITAYDGENALLQVEKMNPDLVVLDLMLPQISGEEVCKAIRKISRIPIIMLTAKIDEDDKINGFNIGADDYVTKPFSPRELMARINSLLRRSDEGASPLFDKMSWNDNDLEVDLDLYTVKKSGEIVNLTPNEFKLLCAMIKYPKKIFTREELIEVAFGANYDGFDRTIDSHIKNLRSKIEDDTTNPRYIVTVRGVGYKFGITN